MKFISVRDRAREALDRLTARLLKDFPEQQGAHSVVFGQAPEVDMGSKHYGWPPEDTRPQFVRKENEGWIPLNPRK